MKSDPMKAEFDKRLERERNYFRDLCLECLDFVRRKHNARYLDEKSLLIKLESASKEQIVTIELT